MSARDKARLALIAKGALERAEQELEFSGERAGPYVCATVELRRDDLRAVLAEVERLIAQRNELLEELEGLCNQVRSGGPFDTLPARAALARVKEGR